MKRKQLLIGCIILVVVLIFLGIFLCGQRKSADPKRPSLIQEKDDKQDEDIVSEQEIDTETSIETGSESGSDVESQGETQTPIQKVEPDSKNPSNESSETTDVQKTEDEETDENEGNYNKPITLPFVPIN